MNIAILIPTLYRPDGLKRVIESLKDYYIVNTDIYIAREFDDFEAYNICFHRGIKSSICLKQHRGPAYAWNVALQRAEEHCKYDAYFLGSDDIEFTPNWLEECLYVLNHDLDGSGLVGVNDCSGKYERAGFATQYLMTRDFIVQYNGGVAACPHYLCDFTDVEACERAKKVNRFAYAPKSIVKHHWRVVDDEGYKRADTRRAEAMKVFMMRKVQNYPDDYEAIVK
jgi:glycosyltransferase involved in cell wall biosynthesis